MKNNRRGQTRSRRKIIKQMLWAGLMTSFPIACRRSSNISPRNVERVAFDWQQFGGTEISVLLDDHPWTSGVKSYLSDFEALTDIKLNLNIVPEPKYFEVLELAIQAEPGEVDAFFLPMDSTAYRLWSQGLLKALSPFINNPQLTQSNYNVYDFPENFRLAATYPPDSKNQELFGIPATFEAYILFIIKH